MTINYSYYVLNARNRNWLRLLTLWRGSLYQLVWPDMIVYFTLYFLISFYYRQILFVDESKAAQKQYFTTVVKYSRNYANNLPLTLILAFYVNIIVTRWWKEFLQIPWPDGLAIHINSMVQGSDERGRLLRRTMIRYINLSWVFLVGMISPQVKYRFPTLEHFIQAGLLLPHEKIILETLNTYSAQPKYWVPIAWASNIAARARLEERITDNISLNLLVAELSVYRIKLGELLNYDWIQIPLVYTHAVTWGVYSYFFANIMGKQFLKEAGEIDLVIPLFHFFEFFFYMGWLKVAEALTNPFGNWDDDLELNYFIDRNFQTGYFIADDLYDKIPLLVKDVYWDCYSPEQIPYRTASMKYRLRLYHGTASRRIVKNTEDQYTSRSFREYRTRNAETAAEYLDRKQEEKLRRLRRKYEESGQGVLPVPVETEAGASKKMENQVAIPILTDSHANARAIAKKLRNLPNYHVSPSPEKDLFSRVALLYKTIAERKKLGSLQTSGYWGSITGPILAENAIFYETEFHKRFVRFDQPVLVDEEKYT